VNAGTVLVNSSNEVERRRPGHVEPMPRRRQDLGNTRDVRIFPLERPAAGEATL
jgi:hypothetical protein